MTASMLDKFILLFWKNCLIQSRHKVQTIMEIAVPVGIAALVPLIRKLVIKKEDPNVVDPLSLYFAEILPLLLLLTFSYNTINIVKYIVIEKEKQLKEAMKIMGLSDSLHWIAWFTKCFIFMMIVMCCLTVLWKVDFGSGAVIKNTNWTIVLFFFTAYATSIICMCFFISTFFSKTNTAATVLSIVWFVTYLPKSFLKPEWKVGYKYLVCLMPNSGMTLGFHQILGLESMGIGTTWANMFKVLKDAPNLDPDISVGASIVIMWISAGLFYLLTLYFDKVLPGEYGVTEKWYFPCSWSYWCQSRRSSTIAVEYEQLLEGPNYEAGPPNRNIGIKIRNLRKVYSGSKVAVKNLNINMYEGQITVLLGHNGAGKTTTMSMLIGMIPPTSGTAVIDGKDIQRDLQGVRDVLGFCPQHNILFDELTVAEHIEFFSRLKGMKGDAVKAEIQKYVNLLQFVDKTNAQSSSLSGGMKRKLSVALALCGGSKIILCDEPTSGMDPSARRALWDLLLSEKQGRTFILSTHFMDEADILGDRIAIMAEGDLKCVGTPFFLKKRFGVGYRLVCVKGVQCHPETMTALLQRYIPNVKVETDIGTELTYLLPAEYVSSFKTIFEDIEHNAAKAGITSFGVSLTTMEEVFLKVGTGEHMEEQPSRELDPIDTVDTYDISDAERQQIDLLTGKALYVSQATATFMKKFQFYLQNKKHLIINLLLPAGMLILMDPKTYGNDDPHITNDSTLLQLYYMAAISLVFLSVYFIMFYIKERVCRSKLLQKVSGINAFIYWTTSFIADYLIYMFATLLVLTTVFALKSDIEIAAEVSLVMLFTGWAMLPFVYIFSFIFTVPSTGYSRISTLLMIGGPIMKVFTFFLQESEDHKFLGDSLDKLFMLIPVYPVISAMGNTANLHSNPQPHPSLDMYEGHEPQTLMVSEEDIPSKHTFFDWSDKGCSRYLLVLLIDGIIWFAVLFFIEFGLLQRLVARIRASRKAAQLKPVSADEDVDVKAERAKVYALTQQQIVDTNLVTIDFTKFYGDFLAVNQLCLRIEGGECFGLLGVNGAGKTSTFKMLTGEERPTTGQAWVRGISIITDLVKANQNVGYCPQFDALIEDLTGRQTLTMFAKIRGIPSSKIPSLIHRLSSTLGFTQHLDKLTKNYSGGNKRKLSTAIALIGEPAVIYLDEPTSGMDPGAKRQLWNIVSKIRMSGSSIVLTSHSMEECEALCTRLAIMVNGEFKCLGSIQHLKNKFSKGFLMTIKMKRNTSGDQIDASQFGVIKNFVAQNFTGADLKEEHSDMLSYHINNSDLRWSHMFGLMEANKDKLNIEDYSLGQNSLEQVFLFHAKYQTVQGPV